MSAGGIRNERRTGLYCNGFSTAYNSSSKYYNSISMIWRNYEKDKGM